MTKTFGITGGAGFIGTNFCDRVLASGNSVVILDDLSRPGADRNLTWLNERHPTGVDFMEVDISSTNPNLRSFTEKSDVIFHLAGQVAVTTSVQAPMRDFEVNALGTLNLLEAVRGSSHRPGFVFVSTNKVYGGLEDLEVRETDDRYYFPNLPMGIAEDRALDFHSPYGCSKGAADQYVLDYGRSYGLSTLVLRQSCIYGTRQFGIEDQGWVAWFIIAAVTGRSLTLYGTGKQVRDILYIDDLVDFFLLVSDDIDAYRGEVLNIGGGAERAAARRRGFGLHPTRRARRARRLVIKGGPRLRRGPRPVPRAGRPPAAAVLGQRTAPSRGHLQDVPRTAARARRALPVAGGVGPELSRAALAARPPVAAAAPAVAEQRLRGRATRACGGGSSRGVHVYVDLVFSFYAGV